MTDEELKDTIVYIATSRTFTDSFCEEIGIDEEVAKELADALIAAGYGDVKEAGLERKAYEVASNQYRIWFEEQKDRAEVAEKALDLCETAYILSLNHRATEGISGQAIASDLGIHKFFMEQAKKELAEEGKDEQS